MTNLPSAFEPPKEKNKNIRFLTLSGTFLRESNQIHLSENQILHIRERSNYTMKTPRFFLALEVDGKESYVSSLFPTNKPKVYNADYVGNKYTLDFTEPSKVKIKPRGRLG
jgi:hypothetical protein